MSKVLLWILIGILGFQIVYALVKLIWRLRSEFRRRIKNDPPNVRVDREVIWRDPGDVSSLNFSDGPGGTDGSPQPPFRFLKEHGTGSNPSVSVQDAKGRNWRIKWGDEVRSESFATRFAWAVGYFVETAYFVPEGHIEGAANLQRNSQVIDEHQRFRDARFELDEQGIVKRFDEHSWAWNENPFTGTRELNGLKVLVMLLSNWDNKDVRDVARGSNTAIFYYKLPEGMIEARYLIHDWGASMGKWGDIVQREKWDSQGFSNESPNFVKGVVNGIVQWGYTGQRTEDATQNISVHDIAWLYQYLGKITDQQIEVGLRASGATEDEISNFVPALRMRIDQLRKIAEGSNQ
ncbi:MAG TPA: hypothetical protein VLH08_21975 [Acidobacteriota bacterium]|nr:hypothetical protein [Acidobacteriota bacterium]